MGARETIQIRVTGEEKAILRALAEKKGLTISDYVRNLCTKDVVESMRGVAPTVKLESAREIRFNLHVRYRTILGGTETCVCNYIVTREQEKEIRAFAEEYGITANRLIQTLLLSWLKDKVENVEGSIGDVVVMPRPRSKGDKTAIGVQLTKKDREAIFSYLESSNRKFSALITSLLDAVMNAEQINV